MGKLPTIRPVQPPSQSQQLSPVLGQQPFPSVPIPVFHVYRNAVFNTGPTGGAWFIVPFDSREYDNYRIVNLSTGVLTIPVSGVWRFESIASNVGMQNTPQHLAWSLATTALAVELKRLGELEVRGAIAGDPWSLGGATEHYQNAGDQLTIQLFNGGGNSVAVGGSAVVCWWTGSLVQAGGKPG